MSNLTGTWTELLYISTAAGAAQNGGTNAEKIMNDTATMGVQAMVPGNFWLPKRDQTGRGIKVVARGIYSTTTTAQTLQFTVRGTTTGAQTSGGSVLLQNAAVAPAASQTNNVWELEGDIVLTAMGAAGANSTVQGVGMIRWQNAAAPGALVAAGAWGGGASPGTVATVDTTQQLFINMNVIFAGTTSASNTITLQQLLVYGLN